MGEVLDKWVFTQAGVTGLMNKR